MAGEDRGQLRAQAEDQQRPGDAANRGHGPDPARRAPYGGPGQPDRRPEGMHPHIREAFIEQEDTMDRSVIWIGNDHGGYELKMHILGHLEKMGIPYRNVGSDLSLIHI